MFWRFKEARYDPVQEEIDRRRPGFRRERILQIMAVVLIVVIWVVARLIGIDVPFPFHIW